MEQNYNTPEDIGINEAKIGKVSPITKEQSKILCSQLDKYVCKIYSINDTIGTGFFCKIHYPDQFKLLPVLITNNHVLDPFNLKINTIKITMEDDTIEIILVFNNSRIIYTNKDIDITIIEIKPDLDRINNFLDIDENIYNEKYNYSNKEIYILQYPKGQKSSFSLGTIKKLNNNIVQHKCSTEFGSSGSPILNLSNYKVIGVHKRRFNVQFNERICIKCVIESFRKFNHNILDNNRNNIGKNEVNNFNTNNIINKNLKIDNNKISNKQEEENIFIINNNVHKTHDNNKYEIYDNIYAMRRIKIEFEDLNKNPLPNIGLTVILPDKNNIFEWECTMLGAKDTEYKGGLFYLKVLFPDNYPVKPPEVRFITPIYHVNVNDKDEIGCPLGHVSISILNFWKPIIKMKEVLCNIFALINYLGNPDASYRTDRGEEMKNNRELYKKKIKYFTRKYANPMKHFKGFKELRSWDFTYNLS